MYSQKFYSDMDEAAAYAADVVIPILLNAIQPESAVDIGSGNGSWSRKLMDSGVPTVIAVDGPWVSRANLLIPESSFIQQDISKALHLTDRYDLVLSLEVAEHLPSERADSFVQELTQLSDLVLFSAAIPFQGGTSHINEQWQSYWVEKFAKQNYVGVDYMRRRIWHLSQFNTWYYAQNMIIYVKKSTLPRYPVLEREYQYQDGPPISIVHPEMLNLHLPWQKHLSARNYVRMFPKMFAHSCRAVCRTLGLPIR